MVFLFNMAWKDRSFKAPIDNLKKKTLLLAFFITKGHLRWSVLILAKNAYCKYLLELKTH